MSQINNLVDRIKSNIDKIYDYTLQLKAICQHEHTASKQEQVELKKTSDAIVSQNLAAVRSGMQLLQRIKIVITPSEMAMYDLYLQNLKKNVGEFNQVEKQLEQIRNAREAALEQREKQKQRWAPSSFSFDEESSPTETKVAIQINDQEEVEDHHTRYVRIGQLSDDVVSLNQLYNDLSTMVYQQGTILDNIEHNMYKAEDHTEKGVVELQDAEQSQKGNVNCKCIALFIMILLVTGLLIGVIVKKR